MAPAGGTMSTLDALQGNLLSVGAGDTEDDWGDAAVVATGMGGGGDSHDWGMPTGVPMSFENSSLEMEGTHLSREGREPSNEEIEEYLDKHQLQTFLTDVVMYIARHFPPDPYDFLLDHIHAMVMKHRASRSSSLLGSKSPEPPEEQPAPPPTDSPEEQHKLVQRISAVLRSPEMARTSAEKLFERFSKSGSKLAEDDFSKATAHLESAWGTDKQDSKLMEQSLTRWRFRANAARGTRGMPLWPMEKEDFCSSYPSMLRRVRDRYVPIGAMIRGSLFIREAAGTLEDKYDVGARLGRGAFGEVVLVTLKSTKEKRVCKRTELQTQQKVSHEELATEVELLRSLDHPHITRLFEYFETATQLEMIIEPVFGGMLTNLVRGLYTDKDGAPIAARPPALQEEWLATLFSQLLSALEYAHTVVGLIHKDLKTDNVLMVGKSNLSAVEQLKEPVHAMLADFGIAEVFHPHPPAMLVDAHDSSSGPNPSPSPSMSFRTARSSRVGGTLGYMSPEMFKGSFTEKSDQWSLGAMMFQMMTGELPYIATNLLMQAHKVCCPRTHPRWELLTQYSWSLGARWFCQQLLCKDEGMRPTAAEALKSEWILKTRPPQAKAAPTASERTAMHQHQMQSHLQSMALHCITSQLNLSQLQHMNLRFQQYDASGDGRLSHVEMRQVLSDVGVSSGEEVELLIESLDSDHSGVIEYSEFVTASLDMGGELVKSHLRVAFDVFDLDGSGALTVGELTKVLTEGANPEQLMTRRSASTPKGRSHTPSLLPDGKTVEEVMAELDKDHTGKVEFAEFQRYMLAEHEESGKKLAAVAAK